MRHYIAKVVGGLRRKSDWNEDQRMRGYVQVVTK